MRVKSNGQAGAATLVITMLLLFITSVSIFYINRGLIFEQKTSANQNRATSAFEMAEAGIEWATAMLNTPNDIDLNCVPQATTNVSFRRKYVQTMFNDATSPSSNVIPATNVFPGCKVNSTELGTELTCGCPAVPAAGTTAAAALGTTEQPGFTVSFAPVPIPGGGNDTESVLVTAVGCTAQSDACTSNTAGESDASSSVSVILKIRPQLRAAPASAVTCGNNCNLGGSFDVVNTDVATNGILVNAGGDISDPSTMVSLPGQPAANAMVQSDSSLSTLATSDPTCTNSNMFKAYFGSTLQQYQSSPSTKEITCTNAKNCGDQTVAAYGEGWRSFYYAGANGVEFNNASFVQLGSKTDPVTLVSEAGIKFNGNIEIYGLVFSNEANGNANGTGTSDIYGALVTCGDFNATGNGLVQYDAETLKNVRRSSGILVRVPGSWQNL